MQTSHIVSYGHKRHKEHACSYPARGADKQLAHLQFEDNGNVEQESNRLGTGFLFRDDG